VWKFRSYPSVSNPQPGRQVAMLGLDFVNLPFLLILSVSQLLTETAACCLTESAVLRESRRLPRPRDTDHCPSVCRW
jgi:hypothetical protein